MYKIYKIGFKKSLAKLTKHLYKITENSKCKISCWMKKKLKCYWIQIFL